MKFIRSKQGFNPWKIYHNDTNTYEAAVVSFDKPSVFGMMPTEEIKAFYNEIINKLN